jgi:predicted ABC-type ATPase
LIVAGPNGSGKTTVTERGLAHEWFGGCEYINPDTIARDEFGDWNSDSAVRKAANVAQERRERAVRERREVDRLYLYDNSLDGAPPRLIARASKGEIVRRYGPEPSWMGSILAAMS